MNYHIYALYSRIFDDILALDAAGESAFGLSFHGNAAGAALRVWALARKLDVAPETIDGESSGRSWTVLNVRFAGSSVDNISVHLTDDIPAAGSTVEPGPSDSQAVEIPF